MKEKRKLGLDLFKLIAAIFVIGIHTYFMKDYGEPYYTIVDYVFRFAVPFFFACSGFFFMKKIKGKKEKEIKYIIKEYLKKLLKLWLIWGSIYFLVSVIKMLIAGNGEPIQIIIRQIIKALVSQPGGGLWYLNTIIYTLVVLYFFYKSDKDLSKITMFFLFFYLFNYLWGIELFKGTVIANLYNKYMSIMSSDRIFLFKGYYFIIGMNIFVYKKENSRVNPIIEFCISYIIYILASEFGSNNIFLTIVASLAKIKVTVALFKIGYLIKGNTEKNKWLGDNCGKMSHIIYFTGSLVILLVETLESLMELKVEKLYSANFIICSSILIVYSIIVLKTEKGMKLYKKIY